MRRSLGFNLDGLYAPSARMTGSTATARTFYHEGIGTILCWADRDLDVAVACFTNGYRVARLALEPDESGREQVVVTAEDTGLRRSRELSDAIRTACGPPP
ncbi:MAG TPA: hypothetical protein VH916_10640 [Dehalococcoidia bacterium]